MLEYEFTDDGRNMIMNLKTKFANSDNLFK